MPDANQWIPVGIAAKDIGVSAVTEQKTDVAEPEGDVSQNS